MPSVIYRRGDVFEQGADLTVLPCSAKGHISRTAEVHVARFRLPRPQLNELGQIELLRFPGPGSITRYVAWAASVMEYTSTADIIRIIGQCLAQCSNENPEIQLIESPLLGTGAGGLDARVAGPSLRQGFLEMSDTDAVLVIYGQQATMIEDLRKSGDTMTEAQRDARLSRPPTAFISYCWESDEHKAWVKRLAERLRSNGVEARIDHWIAVPGDQLPEFMEREIRQNDYVLIVCTPTYRRKADTRTGGVGYEGDIMTAEVMTGQNHRKFIPILAKGGWQDAAPSWLKGKYHIRLREGDDFESGYNDLLTTLHGSRPQPPPVGKRPASTSPRTPSTVAPIVSTEAPPRVLGVIVDEVTQPRLDGSPGSGLYRVPFRLSHRPSPLWRELFIQTWNRPPRFTTMHRPRIAAVTGDKIILDGTTLEEVEQHHKETLLLCVETANEEEAIVLRRRKTEEENRNSQSEQHRAKVEELSRKLGFEDTGD